MLGCLEYLEMFEVWGVWGCLRVFGGLVRCLEIWGDFWLCLEVFRVFEGIWGWLDCLENLEMSGLFEMSRGLGELEVSEECLEVFGMFVVFVGV